MLLNMFSSHEICLLLLTGKNVMMKKPFCFCIICIKFVLRCSKSTSPQLWFYGRLMPVCGMYDTYQMESEMRRKREKKRKKRTKEEMQLSDFVNSRKKKF